MDFQRILILVGLAATSYMLILAWNEDYGANGKLVKEPEEVVAEVYEASPATAEVIPEIPADIDSGVIPQLEEATLPAETQTVTTRDRLVQVNTDVLEVQIDLTGGDIVQVALPAYPATLDRPDVPFLLVDPRNNYVAQSGLIGPSGTDRSDSRPEFTVNQNAYDLGTADTLTVSFRITQKTGAVILKHFIFERGDYLIRVEYEIRNASSEEWRGALFTQIKRDGQMPISFSENRMGLQPYVGGATRSEKEFYRKIEFGDLEEEPYKLSRQEGYIALVQHYFVSAWVPVGDQKNTYQARKLSGKDVYLFGFTTQATSIAAGQTGKLAAQYYVGPKDQYQMRAIAEGLDLTADYGFLWWLSQPLF